MGNIGTSVFFAGFCSACSFYVGTIILIALSICYLTTLLLQVKNCRLDNTVIRLVAI
jgi:hypothetical protein